MTPEWTAKREELLAAVLAAAGDEALVRLYLDSAYLAGVAEGPKK